MTLIETNSPLYLKRLVRELNNLVDGFYASPVTLTHRFATRCNRARLHKGQIQVKGCADWFVPLDHNFSDAYGRAVVASRVS